MGNVRTRAASLVGKGVVAATRLRGGHGSAFPGLVVERLQPRFLQDVLGSLPLGTVVVSGTNGKTTTTKMVVALLRAAGLRVFTNPSGSNFTRGVVSEAVRAMRGGRLRADIAVVELDEAYAVHFVRQLSPNACLLLNVLRDQLDRFGEIDTTAGMLRQVAAKTLGQVVLNAGDPRIAALASAIGTNARVSWFGADSSLASRFPTDEQLHGPAPVEPAPIEVTTREDADEVVLLALAGQHATYRIDGHDYDVTLSLYGPHNALNGAAALALTRAVLGDRFDAAAQVAALGKVRAAFGRGEVWDVGSRTLRLTLVKNPSGFRLALAGSQAGTPTLIAINDEHADGRDVSWLWDVDFAPIATSELVRTTGVRASDMALRLKYAGIEVDDTEADLSRALHRFLQDTQGQDVQVFSTYTAMLKLRAQLKALASGQGARS